LRQQNDYYERLKIKGQTQENNNYGRQLSHLQAQANLLLPLQQIGPVGETLRRSSKASQTVVIRQKKKQFILKKIQKYKLRNKFRPRLPAYKLQFNKH